MTELVWDGMNHSEGKKLGPIRVEFPFQTVETINESVEQCQLTLKRFFVGRSARIAR
jgi:hypothetical protein